MANMRQCALNIPNQPGTLGLFNFVTGQTITYQTLEESGGTRYDDEELFDQLHNKVEF